MCLLNDFYKTLLSFRWLIFIYKFYHLHKPLSCIKSLTFLIAGMYAVIPLFHYSNFQHLIGSFIYFSKLPQNHQTQAYLV